MKSIVLSSVVAAMLVFTGCNSKQPAVDTQDMNNTQTEQEVQNVQSETVSPDNRVVQEGDMSLEAINAKLASESVYFDFDKFAIRTDMQDKIDTAAEVAKNVPAEYSVKLEGNCDEWGSDEYNFALGLKRAQAVKKALVADGVDAAHISTVSYGKSNPVCTEQTQECWAKNRRVDFKVQK